VLQKILGCVVIVMCAAKIGFDEAARFTRRVREIREFQTALVALKGEIGFCKTPLPQALAKVGQNLKTSIRHIFIKAGGAMKEGGRYADEVWETTVSTVKKDLSLKSEEIYILNTFGKLLGTSDVVGQIENIELTSSKLDICERQALDDEIKFARLYRSLGVIGGIFTAILFL